MATNRNPLQSAAEKILTNKAWSYYSAGATDELSKPFPVHFRQRLTLRHQRSHSTSPPTTPSSSARA